MKNGMLLVAAGAALLLLSRRGSATQTPPTVENPAPLPPQEAANLVGSTTAVIDAGNDAALQYAQAMALKARNEAIARAREILSARQNELGSYSQWAGIDTQSFSMILSGELPITAFPWLTGGGLQSRTGKSFEELRSIFGVA